MAVANWIFLTVYLVLASLNSVSCFAVVKERRGKKRKEKWGDKQGWSQEKS